MIEHAGIRLYYEVSGNPKGEPLVFGNSLGSNLQMWDRVVPLFGNRYRVVRFDMRGHGRTSLPAGPYGIGDLGRDVLGLLDELDLGSVNFCGLSLGGMVAMWLGIHTPNRLRRLMLANTAARIGTSQMWNERIANVERSGMAALAETTPTRWFTAGYREENPHEMEKMRAMVASTNPAAYSAACSVLRDTDLTHEIENISAPCLVIAGTHDPATPPSDGRAIQQRIPNARYVELNASHLSAWERAEEFGAEVVRFLQTGEVRNG